MSEEQEKQKLFDERKKVVGSLQKSPDSEWDRLTLVMQMHYEHFSQPTFTMPMVQHSAVVPKSGSGCYFRPLIELQQGVKTGLDLGWVKRPGLIVVRNNTANKTGRLPTKEEREFVDSQILIVWIGEQKLLVHPGMPALFCPEDHSKVYLESAKGVVSASLTVVPSLRSPDDAEEG